MDFDIDLLALAGMGDTPDWMCLLYFALVPCHLCEPLMDSALRLSGSGIPATVFQGLSVAALGWGSLHAVRAKQWPKFIRYLVLPAGYPVVVLVTNPLPVFLSRLL